MTEGRSCGIRLAASVAAGAMGLLAAAATAAKPAGPPQADYRDLLHEYPLVVVASWDRADHKARTAGGKVGPFGRIRLRVHNILKGRCSSIIEVGFQGGFHVRYGADSDDPLGGWRPDAARPGRNTWAICLSEELLGPETAVPYAVVRDLLRPGVYFLGRKDGPTRDFDYGYLIRGRKWRELPLLIPGPYRRWRLEGLPDEPGGGSRSASSEAGAAALVIDRIGQVQPESAVAGWDALLHSRPPGVVFRALQDFDPCSRNAALAQCRRRRDYRLWQGLLDAAIKDEVWAVLDEARDPLAGRMLLTRLASGPVKHYSRLWAAACSASPGPALAAAKEALESSDTPVAVKIELLWRLRGLAHQADGGDHAALVARQLRSNAPAVRRAAVKTLIIMLVERGGAFPTGPQYEQLSAPPWCRRGALGRVKAAITEAIGPETFAAVLEGYPELGQACRPRTTRGRPEPRERLAEHLKRFERGRFPTGSLAAPWDALARSKPDDFALETMARALTSERVKRFHRRRCMVGLIESAILFPDRVRAALAKVPGGPSPDVLAVRCFLAPATDAAPLVGRLLGEGGPAWPDRARWYCRAIGNTAQGRQLLSRLVGAREASAGVRRHGVEVMVRLYGPQAASEALGSAGAVSREIADLCRPAPAVPTPAQRLEAIELLERAVARVAREGPLTLSDAEFEPYESGLSVLARGRSGQAARALHQFILQRPYRQDFQTAARTPPGALDGWLAGLAAMDTRLYFDALQDLSRDGDWQWRRAAYDHLGRMLGATRYDAAGVIAEFAGRGRLGPLELRLALLEYFGHPIGRAASGEGVRALARACFGDPSRPLSEYSLGGNDQAAAHLAEWVIGREFGPVGGYAVQACKGIPEAGRTEALTAALLRILRQRPPASKP